MNDRAEASLAVGGQLAYWVRAGETPLDCLQLLGCDVVIREKTLMSARRIEVLVHQGSGRMWRAPSWEVVRSELHWCLTTMAAALAARRAA